MAIHRRLPEQSRQPRPYIQHFSGTIILNDIDDLITILGEKCKSVGLYVETDTLVDTADDLTKATEKELEKVSIRSEEPNILISFGDGVVGNTEDPDVETRRLIDKVAEFLLAPRNKAPWRWRLRAFSRSSWPRLVAAAIAAILTTTVAIKVGVGGDDYLPTAIDFAMLGAAGVFIIIASILRQISARRRKRAVVLVLPVWREQDRAQRAASGRELKVALVAGIIGAVVGAALSPLFTNLFGT